MGGGTGRLTGRDVKREPTMHVYIVSLYHGNPISAEPSLRKQTAPTATKTGQFYHVIFIMLTLQIVPGRNILMQTRDKKSPIPANVPSRLPYKQS